MGWVWGGLTVGLVMLAAGHLHQAKPNFSSIVFPLFNKKGSEGRRNGVEPSKQPITNSAKPTKLSGAAARREPFLPLHFTNDSKMNGINKSKLMNKGMKATCLLEWICEWGCLLC